MRSSLSLLLGIVAVVCFPHASFAYHDPVDASASNSNVATGLELLYEMKQLQSSLHRLQMLLENAGIEGNHELMNKAAKAFRRARWLVHASNHEMTQVKLGERRTREEERREMETEGVLSKGLTYLRGETGSSVITGKESISADATEVGMPEDEVARRLYDQVRITQCLCCRYCCLRGALRLLLRSFGLNELQRKPFYLFFFMNI